MEYGALAKFTFDWIGREIDPERWCYHSLVHTRAVVEDAGEFGLAASLSPAELELLRAAALLHDTGYAFDPGNHEQASAAFARRILPQFGATPEEVERAATLILATKLPYHPVSELEALLCDADLGRLGTADFSEMAARLRRELAAGGRYFSELEWLELEYGFLSNTTYFTAVARERRGAGLLRNLEAMRLAVQRTREAAACGR